MNVLPPGLAFDFICSRCHSVPCWCTSQWPQQGTTEENPKTGWICPRCQKVHAPFVPECSCKPEKSSKKAV